MDQLSGVIHVVGEPDTGKTQFALEAGSAPERTCIFDNDVKGRSTIEELRRQSIQFGRYVDLIDLTKGKTELDKHNLIMAQIKDIQPNQFDHIIVDTWTDFASTCHAVVTANPQKFKQKWSPMGKIRGAEEWREARRLETEIVNHLASLATTVTLITHLKKVYINNVEVPGKMEPACSKVLVEVPRFRLWLRHNPRSGVPIGLVLKRIHKPHVAQGKIRTVNVLPRKLTPRPGDKSLWDTIAYYWDNPIDERTPTADETPNEYELSILESTLTVDQKVILREMLQAGVAEKEEEAAIASSMEDGELIERARELQKQKKPVPLIAKEMNLSVTEVQALLKHEEVAF